MNPISYKALAIGKILCLSLSFTEMKTLPFTGRGEPVEACAEGDALCEGTDCIEGGTTRSGTFGDYESCNDAFEYRSRCAVVSLLVHWSISLLVASNGLND